MRVTVGGLLLFTPITYGRLYGPGILVLQMGAALGEGERQMQPSTITHVYLIEGYLTV
jgi:hypothetical protein